MSLAADTHAREQALDLAHSYCVRAPAGSGKTGLLVQRMLAALAVVDNPEQVLAITFTRKAAAEIRERVCLALQAAADAQAPASAFDAQLQQLGQRVLERSAQCGWNLLSDPSRLRASTIDSLNRDLARQMPVLGGLGGAMTPLDDARELYRSALETALLRHAEPDLDSTDRAALQATWALGQNRMDTLLQTLQPLLAQREQWAQAMANPLPDKQTEMAAADWLQQWTTQSLVEIDALWPTAHREEWLGLLQTLAAEGAAEWRPLCDLHTWPAPEASQLQHWQTLANSVLTKDGTWRKPGGLRSNTGFPAGTAMRRAKVLLPEWVEGSDSRLPSRLCLLLLLPAELPQRDAQLSAQILRTLHLSLAELRLLFAFSGQCDHTEIALAARQALAQDESGAAARADAQLRHILVDEMQDTSQGQIELLTRLVADWQLGDGRSLFLVGDPQQSIYLFRQARVEKFARLLEPGARLGPVPLQRLQLWRNFRSQGALVEWTNTQLQRVFHAEASPIAFAPGLATRAAAEAPEILLAANPEAEAEAVCQRIQDLLRTDDTTRIAILARTRRHLLPVAGALRTAGIPFAGIELEALAQTPAVRDYLAIVRVLHQAEDDLAWLRLLRCAGVGMSWAECDALAAALPAANWAERVLSDPPGLPIPPGWRRLREAWAQIDQDDALRADLPEAARQLHHALLLPHTLDARQHTDIQRLEAHLREHCPQGRLADEGAFLRSLDKLWAAPVNANVELMTVHKSKGLEFAAVFVIGMARGGSRSDHPPLSWHPDAGGAALGVPPESDAHKAPSLYRWQRAVEQSAEAAERLRVLYVALTRARQQLILCFSGPPKAGSLGWPLRDVCADWEQLVSDAAGDSDIPLQPVTQRYIREADAAPVMSPGLRRTPARRGVAPSQLAASERDRTGLLSSPSRLQSTLVGTSVHEALERLARDGIDLWQTQRDEMLQALGAGLSRRGLPRQQHAGALQRISQLLDQATTGQGQELLAPYPWARSEYALSGVTQGRLIQGVIDRCYETADGTLWVIDYKTDLPPADAAQHAQWLNDLRAHYAPQLERYGALLSALRQPRNGTQLGLYVIALDRLLAWRPEAPPSL